MHRLYGTRQKHYCLRLFAHTIVVHAPPASAIITNQRIIPLLSAVFGTADAAAVLVAASDVWVPFTV